MFSDTHSNTAYWSSGDKWPAMICGSGERRLADAPPSFDAHREGSFATVHSAARFYSVLIRVDPNNPSSTTHFVCDLCAAVPQPTDNGRTYTLDRKSVV